MGLAYFNYSWVLFLKSIKVIIRNRGYFLTFALSPFLVILFMYFYQKAYDAHMAAHDIIDFPEVPIRGIPKCPEPEDCASLGVFVVGPEEPWIPEVQTIIAKNNQMQVGKDVKYVGNGTVQDLQEYIEHNQNKTQIFLVFCTNSWKVTLGDLGAAGGNKTLPEQSGNASREVSFEVPCRFEEMTDSKLVFYSLVVNSTIGYSAPVFRSILFPIPYNPVTVNTKKEVDEALMIYFKSQNPDSKSKDESFTYELTSQGYPVSTQRIFKNFDFFSMRGSFFFYLPIAIAFLIVVTEMNYEKDKGIKMFMISAGMRSGAYWLSWIMVNSALSGYIAATVCITCSLLGVPLFTKVPFWLMFMVFFSSAFGMNTIGFIINVVCYSKTLRQAVSYGFLLISFFFQIFFSAPNSTNIFYSEGFYSSVMTVLKLVLSCYPGYSYTKMFADIVHVSGSFFDTSTFKFSVGKDYTIEDFTNHFTGYLPNGVYFDVPSCAKTMWDLAFTTLVLILLAWYFDNVLPTTENAGIQKEFLFCIKKKEYTSRTVKLSHLPNKRDYEHANSSIDTEIGSLNEASRLEMNNSDGSFEATLDGSIDSGVPEIATPTTQHATVQKEEEAVKSLMARADSFQGILCQNIVKTYSSSSLWQKVLQKVCKWQGGGVKTNALAGLSLRANSGELLSILGQNGAGKTTLMNILSGYMKPDSGKGVIFGQSLDGDIDRIRDFVSLCPQFDIFWEDLTVREHLELIYYLKGLPESQKAQYLRDVLEEINLVPQAHSPISHLSGGMRRRVSIGMSKVGDPKVLFLDEPTTGLDPVNQKEIVKLLETIKKDRVVVLVTHLMEEAEILSDTVVIMHHGRVLRVGNPIELKQELERPYKINITFAKGQEAACVRYLKSEIGPDLAMKTKGNYFAVLASPATVKAFLTLVKRGGERFGELIANWDISTTSLEELFLELTRN